MIKPIAVEFNGIRYRSALEADWASTFTELGIYFQYEPEPLRLDSGAVYDPDFYLPNMRTYCEAKGAHNERAWKPRELAAVLTANETIPREYQVIILRAAGPRNGAVWEMADGSQVRELIYCQHCDGFAFLDYWPLRTEEELANTDERGIQWGSAFCRRCFSEDFRETRAYTPDVHGNEIPGWALLPMRHAPRFRRGA